MKIEDCFLYILFFDELGGEDATPFFLLDFLLMM